MHDLTTASIARVCDHFFARELDDRRGRA